MHFLHMVCKQWKQCIKALCMCYQDNVCGEKWMRNTNMCMLENVEEKNAFQTTQHTQCMHATQYMQSKYSLCHKSVVYSYTTKAFFTSFPFLFIVKVSCTVKTLFLSFPYESVITMKPMLSFFSLWKQCNH